LMSCRIFLDIIIPIPVFVTRLIMPTRIVIISRFPAVVVALIYPITIAPACHISKDIFLIFDFVSI
jgi:hypothetical protein